MYAARDRDIVRDREERELERHTDREKERYIDRPKDREEKERVRDTHR